MKELTRLGDGGGIAAFNALIPYARFLGLDAREDGDGLITVLRRSAANIGNTQIPALHGGAVGALLEHAAILHLLVETKGKTLPKTINVSIDYLRPCLDADTFARAKLIKHGRKIANVRIEAWQDDPEKPVATAHAHFLLR